VDEVVSSQVMTSSDVNLSSSPNQGSSLPPVNLATMFRLGLFQLGLGMMSILTLAVLNRVMITELRIPATITAGVIALHQFVAPARIWFGQLSDTKPLFGVNRSGYVWLGTITFSIVVFIVLQLVWSLGETVREAGGWLWSGETILLTGVLAVLFIIYGLALSSSSTPFAAMLVDVSDDDNRSKLVGVTWSMLMIGIVIGGVSGGIFLDTLKQDGITWSANVGSLLLNDEMVIPTPIATLQTPLNHLFFIAPLVVIALALIATWGVEKTYSRFANRSKTPQREDQVTLGRAFRILTSTRQTGLFFCFLAVVTLSLFMQEAVLEPYGGEVFDMPISETTRLNAWWGLGILLGYSTTGFLVIPRLGKQLTTRIGCFMVAVTFGLMILAGLTEQANVLLGAVFIFGVAAGLTTTGAINLMLDFTAAETAGTFIGAWGLAQALSRASAVVIGGAVLDLGKMLFETPMFAYALVFGLEALTILCAIALLNRISLTEFRESTENATIVAMEGELDG